MGIEDGEEEEREMEGRDRLEMAMRRESPRNLDFQAHHV